MVDGAQCPPNRRQKRGVVACFIISTRKAIPLSFRHLFTCPRRPIDASPRRTFKLPFFYKSLLSMKNIVLDGADDRGGKEPNRNLAGGTRNQHVALNSRLHLKPYPAQHATKRMPAKSRRNDQHRHHTPRARPKQCHATELLAWMKTQRGGETRVNFWPQSKLIQIGAVCVQKCAEPAVA